MSILPREPRLTVGIMDFQREVRGIMNGVFCIEGFGTLSGRFTARAVFDAIELFDESGNVSATASSIRLSAVSDATFTLFDVIIGNTFHWERKKEHTFCGSLVFVLRPDGTFAVINDIGLEGYLESVISSEMSAASPLEFLKAHAIMSRSWLIAAIKRKNDKKGAHKHKQDDGQINSPGEIIRWYEQEEHDIYDVCSDDHCQRYQGISRIISEKAHKAVLCTSGRVLIYRGEVCDARYYKACGGITEDFRTAWQDVHIPYLKSVSDAADGYAPIVTEQDARNWILSEPDAYCNVKDESLLKTILPDFDLETKGFFRWKTSYVREELEAILREKSGHDFGTLQEITPIQRGPSGRICRLLIKGSKKSMIVGKELEIRRWLSKSHLYSSAFIAEAEYDESGAVRSFSFYGAGWGHGVGLCQIGAANMASQGRKAEEILLHYFPGTMIERAY